MKFQNKSPEEIVRRYRRNVRLKQGLVILALLAYTAFAIREIWWNDVSFLGLLLGELLVFLALTPVGVWIAWDFLALNAILNINCDPVTYAQVMHLLGQDNFLRGFILKLHGGFHLQPTSCFIYPLISWTIRSPST